jgi:hypothetical protein
MPNRIDTPEPGSTENELTTLACRRRPGRLKHVHSSLIPLLRGTAIADAANPPADLPEALIPPPRMDVTEDDLSPARGIIFGIVLSVPIWTIFGLGVYRLLN